LAQIAQTQSVQYPLVQYNKNIATSLNHDDPFVISKTIAFDVNRNSYYDHLTIHENVSSTIFPGGIAGGVQLVRGDRDQQHDFLVLVRISSSSEEALDLVSISNETQTVYVNSTVSAPSPSTSEPKDEFSIAIDIIIFVKPGVLQFGTTTIWTSNLNIDIRQDLYFETYHMYLYATQGSITGIESFAFTAHEISISIEHGSILGNWSLPSSISLTTDTGDIDIALVPKRWSSGPWTKGNLTALAKTGDIAIRMPLEENRLSLRNGTTRIEAHKGSITGTFVHGSVTSLLAYNSITATLLPYWAFYEWEGIQHNHITTSASHGNTTIEVLPPIIDTYYKINPLFFSISRHIQSSDAPPSPLLHMNVTYPGQWGGTATGHAGFGGLVYVSGEDFEEIEKNVSVVRVERRPLGSELWFEVEMGIAELRLEGCDVLGCGFSKGLEMNMDQVEGGLE
jgi:hypothetical protein